MSSNTDKSTVLGIFRRAAIPKGATPVKYFDLNKYLGKWYDIARLNFFFEDEDVTNVTAEYSLRPDGLVEVKNTGYDEKKDKWNTSIGKAKFRGDSDVAALEVTFGGLAWAGYNVISVDEDYTYALVFGRDLDLMWILSREIEIPLDIQRKYLAMAEEVGYDTSKLTWTNQDKNLAAIKAGVS